MGQITEHKPYIFNIQHYSLHDGPGIRTIIFFKGCPMRCRWCCNPESQKFVQEISYVENKCIGHNECGFCQRIAQKCVSFPENGGDVDGKAKIDLVNLPLEDGLKCVQVCPAKALKLEGQLYTVKELLDIVEKDAVFFNHGDGGLTVSGGEPLAHKDFLVELLQKAHQRRISTAIETCGCVPYENLFAAVKHLDTILFDIKSLNDEKHKLYTGHSNQRILDNFTRLCQDYPDTRKIVRTPVIPGFNDTREDIEAILSFLQDKPNVEYEALPYHRFGEGKYKALGREYPMGNVKLSPDKLALIKEINKLNQH